MIFLRVLHKIFLWPPLYTLGPQELGGPGSLNRLNPRFLRHCRLLRHPTRKRRHVCRNRWFVWQLSVMVVQRTRLDDRTPCWTRCYFGQTGRPDARPLRISTLSSCRPIDDAMTYADKHREQIGQCISLSLSLSLSSAPAGIPPTLARKSIVRYFPCTRMTVIKWLMFLLFFLQSAGSRLCHQLITGHSGDRCRGLNRCRLYIREPGSMTSSRELFTPPLGVLHPPYWR